MKYSTIVFDCDGVILDSNHIKTEAMRKTVCEYSGPQIEEFIVYHQEKGGVSRYQKLDYFLRTIVGDYSEKEYKHLLEKLSLIVEKDLLSANFTRGVEEFIEKSAIEKKLFIVTGGDQAEVRNLFEKRDKAHFFTAIYGSPVNKYDHCEVIKKTVKEEEAVLFIGDSRLDHEVAKAYGFDFIFVSGYTDFFHWKEYCEENSIENFVDFDAVLEKYSL